MTARTDAILAQVFAALADWQVAETLNAQTETGLGDASLLAVQNILLLSGEWGQIKVASKGTGSTAVLAENALALFESPDVDAIGFGDSPAVLPAITAMLDALVGLSLISSESRSAILAMSNVTKQKWSPMFTDEEVGNVRKAAGFYG